MEPGGRGVGLTRGTIQPRQPPIDPTDPNQTMPQGGTKDDGVGDHHSGRLDRIEGEGPLHVGLIRAT